MSATKEYEKKATAETLRYWDVNFRSLQDHATLWLSLLRFDHSNLTLTAAHVPLWFLLQTFFCALLLTVLPKEAVGVAAVGVGVFALLLDLPLGLVYVVWLWAVSNAAQFLVGVVPAYLAFGYLVAWIVTLLFEGRLHVVFQQSPPRLSPPLYGLQGRGLVSFLLYFNSIMGPFFLLLHLTLVCTSYNRPLNKHVVDCVTGWRKHIAQLEAAAK